MEYYGEDELRDFLSHHGILGMHWGKRNCPPYPLGSEDHSASEKKEGWRKSLGSGRNEELYDRKDKGKSTKSHKMTDRDIRRIKKAAIVLGAVTVTAAAIYASKNPSIRELVSKTLKKPETNLLAGEIKEVIKDVPSKLEKAETNAEALRNANPLRNTPEGVNNCVPSSLAGYFRTNSDAMNVLAKSTGGKRLDPFELVKECFEGAKIFPSDGVGATAKKFGQSAEDASSMLKRRFGDNAKGFVRVKMAKSLGGCGHAFSFEITNGNVIFSDFKNGANHDTIARRYFNGGIDLDGELLMINLNGATPNWDKLKDYLDYR